MRKSNTHLFLAAICVFTLISGFVFIRPVAADTSTQSLPLSQNWSNTGLITADDNWNGVPGIIGYRGDGLTGATGTDPQTILADGSGTPVDVNANHADPDTFISGGVTEFDGIANPVVALQGSGTAAAPHLVISINTTGQSGIPVAYNIRDIDGSADNAVQPVALQYRVGNTGSYTNIPAAFVADATTGPSQATQVTAVNIVLPAACDNQPLVQLRIITTNAVGSDEWVGIDDINIGNSGPTTLSGNGSATPNQVIPGGNSLLTVSVTPASNPTSTGITVKTDLSSIGGSATQTFFDDGTNGDVTAGDNVFSYTLTVPANAALNNYSFTSTINDAQARNALALIGLTVVPDHSAAEHLVMGNPSNATTDVNNPSNYLLAKTQYVMSYNRDRGEPNWVSWHLDSTWLGNAPRQDSYRPDTSLPAGWYQVQATDYSGSGFDRGHMCPSADRTDTVADNDATFLMTNFVPQAPNNNQGPWEDLEGYLRGLVAGGNEIYIIAGGVGDGGSGSNGGTTLTVANGHVAVPAYTWKVALILPNGTDDVNRVGKTTRVIAVLMPNQQSIGISTPWRNFRTSVRRIEGLTGYNFFSNVPRQIQYLIESRVDTQ